MAGRAAPCPELSGLKAPPPVSRLVANSRLPVRHRRGLSKPKPRVPPMKYPTECDRRALDASAAYSSADPSPSNLNAPNAGRPKLPAPTCSEPEQVGKCSASPALHLRQRPVAADSAPVLAAPSGGSQTVQLEISSAVTARKPPDTMRLPGHPAEAFPTVSRRLFMSTASIAAAATIVTSPSIAATDISAAMVNTSDSAERLATERLGRAEQMIEALRTRYICRDWKFDEDAGERLLRFFRSAVRFPKSHEAQPGYEDEWTFVIRFVGDHGQCLDWLISGGVDGLICGAASRSSAARRATVDPINAAIEAHRSALSEFLEFVGGKEDDDDPVYEGKIRSLDELQEAAATELTNVQPTTMMGVLTLLSYIHEINAGGIKSKSSASSYSCHDDWPETLVDDETKNLRGCELELPFPYWVMENIRAAISELA